MGLALIKCKCMYCLLHFLPTEIDHILSHHNYSLSVDETDNIFPRQKQSIILSKYDYYTQLNTTLVE